MNNDNTIQTDGNPAPVAAPSDVAESTKPDIADAGSPATPQDQEANQQPKVEESQQENAAA